MQLSPRTGAAFGHRRAHSSALEICAVSSYDQQELNGTRPLLDEKSASEPFVKRRRIDTVFVYAWVVSVVLTFVCTYLGTARLGESHFGTFTKGFTTELAAARLAIHTRTEQFYGSLDFNGHHGFVPPNSPSLKYIGSTSEVDEAWEVLSKDRYFLLSDTEVQQAFGQDPSKYWNVHHGGVVVGLDALHTLHCLNHLRMSIYPDVYPQDPIDGPMHKAHCVDHLRQLVMCNADLTPVPTQYFVGLERNYINSSRVHTCRDFSRIREWATERFNGSTAVKPRNRDGTPRESFYAPWSP